jgi:hypothetical protein
MPKSIKEDLKVIFKSDFMIVLDKIRKCDVVLNIEEDSVDEEVTNNIKVLNKNLFNYEFITNQEDIYISFPDVMIWTTK